MTVPFHGFNVPLIGVSEDECSERCDRCGERNDFLQTRMFDGLFLCLDCLTKVFGGRNSSTELQGRQAVKALGS